MGSAEAIGEVLRRTVHGQPDQHLRIERLNATFRANLSGLVRRGRCCCTSRGGCKRGMYLLGCVYNFCWEHDSLRIAAAPGRGTKWVGRTPAECAGLAERAGRCGNC